ANVDHLAGDLVTEDETLRRRRAPADHVLVRAADIGGDAPEDRRVWELAAHVGCVDARPILELKAREVDVLDLDLPRAHVGNASVVRHLSPLSSVRWVDPRSYRRTCPDSPGRVGACTCPIGHSTTGRLRRRAGPACPRRRRPRPAAARPACALRCARGTWR